MGTLTVTYVRSESILLAPKTLSIEIDGKHAGEIHDRMSLCFDLPDGHHVVVLRALYSKRIMELDMDGDVSFTFTWHKKHGGLTSGDGLRKNLPRNRYGRTYIGLVTVIAAQIANFCLYCKGLYTGEIFLTLGLICFTALAVLVGHTLKVRGNTTARDSDPNE